MNELHATVIGAGLAGSEAAWQLARQGIRVTLYEMKPGKSSPAHHSTGFAELVCSNSLRSDELTSAVGLLKAEMRLCHSLIMEAADASKVPAGGALAVDRDLFSGYVTDKLRSHPLIEIRNAEITEIPDGPVIIATGPLTSDALAARISQLPGLGTLHFYDAAAPIVTLESLNMERVFRMNRYGRGGDDYLNCPMSEAEYNTFIDALLSAETAEVHGFEEKYVFEGCMPIESEARRGRETPAHGTMKPVGLPDPRTGKEAYAVVQLRQDNAENTMYNIVGFQTRLKWPERRRVFGLIPGLEHAEYVRYGVMHRNTFLQSPGFLNAHYEMISRPMTYFAGQMTGVEGYIESAGSGLYCGLSLGSALRGLDELTLPPFTAMGGMGRYVATPRKDFQPMKCTYELIDKAALENLTGKKKKMKKFERYTAVAEYSLAYMRQWTAEFDAALPCIAEGDTI